MKRPPLTILSLTFRGIFFVALSLAVLAEGILRSDMAALFWGSSFLLVALYAALGGLMMRFLLSGKKRTPGFLQIVLPPAALEPGEEAEAHLRLVLPRLMVPGFAVRFRLPLSWAERVIEDVSAPLAGGANQKTILFMPRYRGAYSSAAGVLEVRDVLGLTLSPVRVSAAERLRVFPRISRDSRLAPIRSEGGDATRYANRRRRSEELLEVRPYFPGDDIRKLNWKIFAHSSELFLRVGEVTPPPQARYLFILDPTDNPLVPREIRADYLDVMVEACASAMTMAMEAGTLVLFHGCGTGARTREFSTESLDELFAALSEVWWSPPEPDLELPSLPGLHVFVFSSPGSVSLPRIMRELSGRRWKTTLHLQGIGVAPRARRVRKLGDVFFVPAESPEARPVPEKKLQGFREAMAAEASRYRSSLLSEVREAPAMAKVKNG